MSRSINGLRNSFQSLLTTMHNARGRRPRLRKRRGEMLSPVSVCAEVLEVRALLSAGSIDTTYGNAGIGSVALPSDTSNMTCGASALQADGKEVVAGTRAYQNAGQNLVVSRFNTNGTLDTTFGDKSGSAKLGYTTELVVANGKAAADYTVDVHAVFVQADGKILVAGLVEGASSFTPNSEIYVSRFNTNGTIDTTFGKNGRAVFDYGPGSSDNATDMVLTPQGNILLSVTTANSAGTSTGASFLRLNASGALDTTFGTNGLVTFTGTAALSGLPSAGKILLQTSSSDPLGYEIILGSAAKPVGQKYAQIFVARFSSSGVLDTSFGTGGLTLTAIPADASHAVGTTVRTEGLNGIQFQSDGKIVAAGKMNVLDPSLPSYNYDAALARYNADGTLDTTFGNAGTVTTIVGTPGQYNTSSFNGLRIDANQRIVAVGDWGGGPNGNQLVVARFTATGSLDTTFGDTGTGVEETTLPPNGASGASLNIQSDGKLLVAANLTGRIVQNPPYTNYYPTIAVVRYNGDPVSLVVSAAASAATTPGVSSPKSLADFLAKFNSLGVDRKKHQPKV